MRVLITGRSGSGKSTICRELVARGQPAFDGDRISGLADWVDTATGQIVSMDYSRPIDRTRYEWRWSEPVIDAFLHDHNPVFMCGSADNDLACFNKFDRVFVLDLPPELQRTRILGRTEHDYGRLPEMQQQIITEQQAFVSAAAGLGALMLDATQVPEAIVHTILERSA
jgi:dephospho-CoA kinase